MSAQRALIILDKNMQCIHVSLTLPPFSTFCRAVVVKNARKEDNSRDIDSSAALEAQTQLPLRIQDSDRTEYVAPVSSRCVCERTQ